MTRAAHDHPGCPPHYAAALEKDLDALLELRGLEEAEALSARLRAFKQARPAGRNRDVPPEALEAVKALRKAAGDYVKRCRLSELSLAQAREDALKLYGVFPALSEAARRIGEAHARRKEERGGLSYADLERCALRALTREEVRNSVRGQYDYVFVEMCIRDRHARAEQGNEPSRRAPARQDAGQPCFHAGKERKERF